MTPSLEGSILLGVTRDSVIRVAREWGMAVSERKVSIDEVVDGCKSGTLEEAFATGTAAVVSPIGAIGYRGKDVPVGDGLTTDLARRLYKELTDIQYGYKDDSYGWTVRIG